MQGLKHYKWKLIEDVVIAERPLPSGGTVFIPNILFRGGHVLGQPEDMPLGSREEAERVLAGLLGMPCQA